MTRMRTVAVCLLLAIAATASVSADVRTDQRVKFQLGGALGKLVNMFVEAEASVLFNVLHVGVNVVVVIGLDDVIIFAGLTVLLAFDNVI